MKIYRQICLILTASFFVSLAGQTCNAQQLVATHTYQSEPNWYPYVIARGEDRNVIENTPIQLRPYRPLHFYGNTVRRSYYRGTPLPVPTDFARSTSTYFRRR